MALPRDERYARSGLAWLMRCSGVTFREIGAMFGVGTEMARTLVRQADRRIVRRLGEKEKCGHCGHEYHQHHRLWKFVEPVYKCIRGCKCPRWESVVIVEEELPP